MSFTSVRNVITARMEAQFPALEPSVTRMWENDGALPQNANEEYVRTIVSEILTTR